MKYDAKKSTVPVNIESSRWPVAVVPKKTPSHTKAMMPHTGTNSSQWKYSRAVSITRG